MALSEKTRKILWGRSGNRCAVCRRELVIGATTVDGDAVVGDECHIVSGKVGGPRHATGLPPERLEHLGNLILLCRVHHKMVDDQCETYTAEVLRKLKENHEKWVASALAEDDRKAPVRIRRLKGNVPAVLSRVTSGQEIMRITGGAFAYSFDHDEPESDTEVDLIGDFLQEAQDWGDLWSDLEAGGQVRAGYRMSTLIRELQEAGFWVFGGREIQRIEGGEHEPSPWPVAILRVVRDTSPEIICFDNADEEGKSEGLPRASPTRHSREVTSDV